MCLLGTFAAGPAFASATSPDNAPVVTQSAEVPGAGQLIPGALNAVTTLPPVAAVTGPVSSVVSTLDQGASASGPQSTPGMTGVVPAAGAATGALVNGLGSTTAELAQTLMPAVGPAVSDLTFPVDDLSQDIGDLTGVPVLGSVVSGLPALPDTGDLLNEVNDLFNGMGHYGG